MCQMVALRNAPSEVDKSIVVGNNQIARMIEQDWRWLLKVNVNVE